MAKKTREAFSGECNTKGEEVVATDDVEVVEATDVEDENGNSQE